MVLILVNTTNYGLCFVGDVVKFGWPYVTEILGCWPPLVFEVHVLVVVVIGFYALAYSVGEGVQRWLGFYCTAIIDEGW